MTVSRVSGVSAEFSPKNNFNATTAPGVSDDASAGYSVGSAWIDTVTDSVYHCADATIGAANWVTATSSGAAWGTITGTLSAQTDLSNALAAKAPLASPTFTGTVTAPATTTTYAINAVNPGLQQFTVTGNARNSLAGGQTFTVSGSTGNNGIYTVSNISYSAPNTTITVSEAIPSAVADGNVTNIFGTMQMLDGQVKMADPAGDAFYMFVDSNGQFLIQCQPTGFDRGVAPVAISKDASQMYLNVTNLTVNGTGSFSSLSASEMTGPAFTGDSGAGGFIGLVPAPAAGDAAASKYLKADGTWAAVAGASATQYAVRAYLSANGTISNATPGKIQFDAETYDPDNFFDSVTNFRFQPTVSGYYRVSAAVFSTDLASGEGLFLFFYKNGSNVSNARLRNGNGTGDTTAHIVDVVFFNGTTDYLELFAQCNAAANRTALGGSVYTYFTASAVK